MDTPIAPELALIQVSDMQTTRRGFWQDSFNRAVAGLAAQGFQRSYGNFPEGGNSPTSRTGCLYRGPDGLKCALGHLIPDDKYLPTMEGGCEAVMAAVGFDTSSAWTADVRFAKALQHAHDNSSSGPEMKNNLRGLAKRWGLELPEVLREGM